MKIHPNEFGFLTLSTKNPEEAEFLNQLWSRGHILIVAKAWENKGGITKIHLGESFKKSWRRK